jgi:RNA polymerase sigma-70 factor (ECF subfamily)
VQHDRAAKALVEAAASADAGALGRMLHPGVELTVDAGGKVPAPRSALSGASEVGRYLSGVLFDPEASLRVASVNGMPGIVVCRRGEVTGVLGIRLRGRRIVQAWLVVNPDKLTGWSVERPEE